MAGLTAEQREARTTGIGGSDAAALLGFGYGENTRFTIWQSKVEPLEPEDEDDRPWLMWGHLIEPVVRQRFSDLTGRVVAVPRKTYRHPEHDWLVANLDGISFANSDRDDPRGYEGKNYRSSDGWGVSGSDEIPDHIWVQCQHYMMVIPELTAFDLAVLIGGQDYRQYEVVPDPEFTANLFEIERAFWFDHVVAKVPPEPVSLNDTRLRWPTSGHGCTDALMSDVTAHAALMKVSAEIKRLEGEKEALQLELQKSIGATEGLSVDGKPIVTWKSDPPKSYIDFKQLAKDNPELAESYKRTKPGSRRFLPKKPKAKQ